MRKVPKKNYFILLLLLAFTVGIVFFARDIYQSRDGKKYVSAMNSFVIEIKLDDLNDYALEMLPGVIFISDKNDSTLNNQETKYKELLTEYNLQPFFVYLDISNETEDILGKFNEKYEMKLTDEKLPILVVIDEGKVITSYAEEEFNKKEIVSFLTENGVIESD